MQRRHHRARIAAVLGTVIAATALSSPASAQVLWASEQTMVDNNYLRNTFIYDVGAGNTITNEQFASPAVSAFYVDRGFDRNFLVWAPITAIDRPSDHWTMCEYNTGGLCVPGNVKSGSQPIADEIGSGQIHVKIWNGAFIGTACGNWNRTGTGPIPAIRGTKYEDLNADGTRQSGEPGLPGWQITLQFNGVPVAHTTTGADGSYAFDLDARTLPIGAGTYTLTETQQPGWTQSQAPAPVQIGYGVGDTTYGGNDFGNYRPASISGRTFEDRNADGEGAGDPGLPDWTITYTGRATGSVQTGADGSYRITGLTPGTYTVGEQDRPGWTRSAPGGAGTHTVTVGSGETVEAKDFGNWRPATVQGRKFNDAGADGSGDGDPGLPDWTITLTGGPEQRTATTAADGAFTFADVRPGTYTVGERQLDRWRQTAPDTGTTTVTVTSGQVLSGVAFGNVCTGEVAVTVPDGVGVRLEQVTVPGRLTNDPPMPRTSTGTSTIARLLPGTYRATLTLPDGLFTTDPDLTALDGHFAIVKTVAVSACSTTVLKPVFVTSGPGKITGGVRLTVPGGYATGGFEFLQKQDGPRGTLEFNDHAQDVRIHTSDITGISVSGTSAYVQGRTVADGVTYSFRLHLVDAGEPGTADRFELLVSNGYSAGTTGPISDGNIQVH